MMTAATAYATRVRGVVLSRLQGPKARKHTRHWEPGPDRAGAKDARPAGLEFKVMDPDYIVPDSLVAESVEAMRDAAQTVAGDAARDAADRVFSGGDSGPGGMFEIDTDLLGELIDEALEDVLGAAQRYADNLREAITEGESDGIALDDLIDNVEEAADKGGNWLRLGARTIGTALAARSVLEQARTLGVTHTQWISRRDERVRLSHRRADGQVRPIGEPFDVGGFALEYPGDPSGLPETAQQVHGCRCGLLLADPTDAWFAEIEDIMESARAGDDDPDAARLMRAATASEVYAVGPDEPGMPDLVNLVPTPTPVVGWRTLDVALDVAPGQRIVLEPGTVLGLAAPTDLDPLTLAVRIPAGTLVGVAEGSMVLTEGAVATVLGSGEAGVQSTVPPV